MPRAVLPAASVRGAATALAPTMAREFNERHIATIYLARFERRALQAPSE